MTATPTANATAAGSSAARPPHLFWTLAEGRALVELGAFYAFRGPLSLLPRGDGHSVLVLPGFLASDRSTKPMRDLLNSLGYDAHGWDMGRNIRIDNAREAQMNELLDRIHASSGRKVSIIGWSLGGVFAPGHLARQPDLERSRAYQRAPPVRAAERPRARAGAGGPLPQSRRGAAGADHLDPQQDRRHCRLARIGAETGSADG
jgi:pimeloyl-ACP methyl ester carboxylesterase